MYEGIVPVRCTEYETSLKYIVRTSIERNIYLSPYIDLPYNRIVLHSICLAESFPLVCYNFLYDQ